MTPMPGLILAVSWAFVLRSAQAAIAAAPYLLLGLLVAGYLRTMVGPEGVRRLFGSGRRGGPVRAWGLATILPVCSLGVLPIVRELRRARVPRGSVLTFALAAPVLNPFSMIYGLTLLQPWIVAVFVGASFVVAVGAGLIAGSGEVAGDGLTEPADDRGRLLSAGAEAARSLVGPAGGYALLGLLGVGLLAMLLPAGSLMTSMVYSNRLAPLMIAPIAMMAHVTPERGMMLVGEMYEHSSSPGAAFVLLVLGAGMNLGLVTLLVRSFGVRVVATWMAGVVGLTLVLGYAINATCYLPGSEEGHTHIFDNFSSPFHGYPHGAAAFVLDRIAEVANPASTIALGGLAALGLAGVVLRTPWGEAATRRLRETRESAATMQDAPTSVWARPVPTRWLTAVAIVGLLGMAVAGAYVYFPSPDEVFEDMRIVRADALSAVTSVSGDDAGRYLAHWESLATKLPIGALIRRGSLNPEMRKESQELREELENLRRVVRQDRRSDEARLLAAAVQKTYDRCKLAYTKP
jgi:uncharacterized membrane protein YraQ (UPF0718 family)